MIIVTYYADGANTQITDDSSLYDDLDDLHSHQPTESHESNTPVTENHHRTVKHITCRKIMFALLALVLMTAAGAYLTWEVSQCLVLHISSHSKCTISPGQYQNCIHKYVLLDFRSLSMFEPVTL